MKIEILPVLADSFILSGFKNQIKNHFLKRALNHPHVRFVANHNIMASKNLIDIGTYASKVIPWDWPPSYFPSSFPTRSHVQNLECIKMLYVGSVSESKGVGDYINAVERLGRSTKVLLNIVGGGDDLFQQNYRKLVLDGLVNFIGKVPHNEIISLMREHDIVVVPSRLDYPEGLPMVIYEAFCSRTPLILSSHPMFTSRFKNKIDVVFFEAGNPDSLASSIINLIRDQQLYSSLSNNSDAAWKKIQCPVNWGDLLWKWLENSSESNQWLSMYSMGDYQYQ